MALGRLGKRDKTMVAVPDDYVHKILALGELQNITDKVGIQPDSRKLNVCYITPLSGPISFGIVGMNCARELDKFTNLRLVCHSQMLPKAFAKNMVWDIPCKVAITQSHPDGFLQSGYPILIGQTVFEAKIPERWLKSCHNQQELWCPSRFVMGLFAEAGISRNKLTHIPHGVNKCYKPLLNIKEKRLCKNSFVTLHKDKRIKFLFMLSWMSGAYRKQFDVFLKAYYHIAKKYPGKVLAVVKVSYNKPKEYNNYISSIFKSQGQYRPEVFTITDFLTDKQMNILNNLCDIGILCSGAEGFGLHGIEYKASGLPFAYTDYSAMPEYAQEQDYKISVDELIPAWGEKGKGVFAKPSVKDIIDAMEDIIENKEETRRKAIKFAKAFSKKWSWERAGELMSKALEKYKWNI